MSCNTLTETQFFSLVSTIASQHACRLVNIAGPSESEYACAVELEEILRQSTADPYPSEFGAIENYLGLASIPT
jgi:hypothetical protein